MSVLRHKLVYYQLKIENAISFLCQPIKTGRYRLLLLCLCFPLMSINAQCPSVCIKDTIDSRIEQWLDRHYYDGFGIEVVKDNSIVLKKNYGGYTDSTVVNIMSTGKWLVAATIATLVDDNILSWSDKVGKYIPIIKGINADATLIQLLSHTSGIIPYPPYSNDYSQHLCESVDSINKYPTQTLPGEYFEYGGMGMQLAGRMAEIASGKDWETIFDEYLAMPLKMYHTHFTPVLTDAPMLAGGARSCLSDYMNFLKMFADDGIFEGKRILSPESIKMICADHTSGTIVKGWNYISDTSKSKHSGIYGLGVWREEVDKNNNASFLSCPGWTGAFPWIDRNTNSYGFILARITDSKLIKKIFYPIMENYELAHFISAHISILLE
jgi:CubicO group peptidase (beta-lactamase class C family)